MADEGRRTDATPGATDFELSSLRPGCRMQSGLVDEERYLAVEVHCDKQPPVRVRNLADLRDLVAINDEASALEFVRLFSRDKHWMLTGIAEWAEVVPAEKKDLTNFVVSHRVFGQCCVPASVRAIDDSGGKSFEISRVLVDRSYRVYLVTEVVQKNGVYQIANRKRLKVNGRDLGLWVIHDR